MAYSNSTQAKNEVNNILKEMHELTKLGLTSVERRNRFDELNTRADRALVAFEELRGKEGREFTPSPRPSISSDGGFGGQMHEDRSRQKKKFTAAFRAYARHGFGGLNAEQRDLLTTSDATGGALIPQIFGNELIEAQRFYGPIATKVKQKVTQNNGAPLKVSLADDTEAGIKLLGTEGTSSPAETDPAFQSKVLGIDTVSLGLVKVSVQELEDSAFDIDAFIRESLGRRYARGVAKAVATGVDVSGTALPNQATGGLLASATVGQTTAVLANGVGWSDLTILYGALDPAYVNPRTTWVFNSTTRAALLGMKDGLTY